MAKNNHLKSLLVFTSSFVGGVTAGLLLAPKNGAQNRRWLSLRIKKFREWAAHQQRKAKITGQKEWYSLRNMCNPNRNIPDLYQATAGLTFNEYEPESE